MQVRNGALAFRALIAERPPVPFTVAFFRLWASGGGWQVLQYEPCAVFGEPSRLLEAPQYPQRIVSVQVLAVLTFESTKHQQGHPL